MYQNCHPYTPKDDCGRRWDSGTQWYDFRLFALAKFTRLQMGDTDSERILLYLVEQINKKRISASKSIECKERFSLLDAVICEMAEGNKLNLLFV